MGRSGTDLWCSVSPSIKIIVAFGTLLTQDAEGAAEPGSCAHGACGLGVLLGPFGPHHLHVPFTPNGGTAQSRAASWATAVPPNASQCGLGVRKLLIVPQTRENSPWSVGDFNCLLWVLTLLCGLPPSNPHCWALLLPARLRSRLRVHRRDSAAQPPGKAAQHPLQPSPRPAAPTECLHPGHRAAMCRGTCSTGTWSTDVAPICETELEKQEDSSTLLAGEIAGCQSPLPQCPRG